MSSPRRFDSAGTFIGRERELAELQNAVAATRSGRGALVLLRGEAGIGKTTLALQIERNAAAGAQPTHWGRCPESSGAPAFWPWVQVLRSVVHGCSAALLATLSEDELRSLARLVPEGISQRIATPNAPSEPNGGSSFHVEIERFQLFDGITRFLRRVAEQSPFGIIFDDLHAADQPSLLLLEFVARQLLTLPVWVIGTYRPLEAHLDSQRSELITTLIRLGRSLDITGLSEPEVGRLIEHIVGESPPGPLRARICHLTAGNPFFVDEVSRLLWSGGDPRARDSAHLPVPSGIREVVRQRLRLLGADCLRMLQVAACIGTEVGFTLLREATDVESARLLDLVAEAVAVGALVGRPERRYVFGHALLRETLYGDLLPSQRMEYHRNIGQAIERLSPDALDEHLPELAFHFGHVAPAGDAHKALAYAERAAQRAASLFAYEDAARLYQIALDTLPLIGAELARSREIELLLALGDVQVRAADSASARQTFVRAAAAARARRDAHGLARAALGCGGLGLGVPPGTVDRALVSLLEEALAHDAQAFPAALRARLLARLALELYFSDATARRQKLMDEASAIAGGCDTDTRAYVMHACLVGLWDLTLPGQRLQRSNELIALAESLHDEDLQLRGHSYRLLEIIDTGMAEAWDPELDTITQLAEQLREPRFFGMAIGTRAMRSVWLGRFEEAETLGQQALELAQTVSDLQAPISIAAQAFFMQRLQGKAEQVEMTARAAVAAMPSVPGTHCMLALALCDLGKLDEARRVIERLDDTDLSLLRKANRLASLVPWLAEACAVLGDVARMQTLAVELVGLAGRNISLQARVCFGPAAFYQGLIAAALGEQDTALSHFESAHELAQRLRGRPLMALIELESARALLALGQRQAAHQRLQSARQIAAALGLELVSRRVAALETSPPAAAPQAGLPAAGHLEPMAARHREPRSPLRAALKRDRALWTVSAGDTVLRCRSSKGLQYLAHLLRHPDKSFHAVELLALDQSASDERLSTSQIDELALRVGEPQTAEPIADAKALAAYRRRIEDLASQLQEATEFNDIERRSRLQSELDILSDTLASAVGIRGRTRATGSFAERARLNVTRAIRSAIERIAEGVPVLGRHLDSAIRTGTFCSYSPPANDKVQWDL